MMEAACLWLEDWFFLGEVNDWKRKSRVVGRASHVTHLIVSMANLPVRVACLSLYIAQCVRLLHQSFPLTASIFCLHAVQPLPKRICWARYGGKICRDLHRFSLENGWWIAHDGAFGIEVRVFSSWWESLFVVRKRVYAHERTNVSPWWKFEKVKFARAKMGWKVWKSGTLSKENSRERVGRLDFVVG